MKTLFAVLVACALLAGCVNVQKSITLYCQNCSNDVFDLSDCGEHLSKVRDDPATKEMARSIGVDLGNVKNVKKSMQLANGNVSCTYTS